MLFWHVPAPNEALLISGSKHRREQAQFRIVTGHGSFVLPVKQKARILSLALREAVIEEECITNQGIRLNVRAVAAFKVGDDEVSIANAARRFLSEQNRMEILVGRVFAGHLRSIVGGLTVEQIIRERDRVAQEIKDGSHAEMEKLGIVVDALEIQEIEDATGYIDNLAQKLEAEVRRPADAEAYRLTTLAKAESEAAKVRADAAAHVERTTAEGQADANKARAASLREGNQELIAANHLIEILPSLVEAAARGLSDSQLTILNGTEGVNEVVAGLVGQGLTILNTLKSSLLPSPLTEARW